MAGIIIPVAIHLWNIRPAKPLPVGSIILLKENGRRSSRRLRLSDLLLLLLRCLLIMLLALLLARPVWRATAVRKEKGWVLMEKSRLQETYRQFQPQIDSLIQSGYTFHYFTPGFPEEDLSAALQDTEHTDPDTASYWALADGLQLDTRAPASLFLFTPHYLDRFHGQRPHIDTGTHWYVYTPPDSVSSWQADAYATASGNIRVRRMTSRAGGNSYAYEELSAGAPVKADTATMQITIFADTYAHDAAYLKAAIAAIQQFTERRIQLSEISRREALPAQTDWLFWLSMEAPPAQLKAENIWKYDSGTVVNTSSRIIFNTTPPLPLFKRIQAHTPPLKALWKDGFGNAILYLEKSRDTRIYHFSSRLDPAWNELPWSAAFPGLLLQLLYPDSVSVPAGKDRRAIAAQQLQPNRYEAAASRKRTALPLTDLAPVFWAIVFAMFLAERILVFSNKRSVKYG